MGVSDKMLDRLVEALKASLNDMLRGSVPIAVKILSGEKSEGINVPGRGRNDIMSLYWRGDVAP